MPWWAIMLIVIGSLVVGGMVSTIALLIWFGTSIWRNM
jgi:hypothetical protein